MTDTTLSFEDFAPGTRFGLGPYRVTRDAVLDFARAYDPQPFHLDEQAAKATLLGGLSASGWHTCGMMMRMMVDGFLGRSTSQGASHVDHIRWLAPVRPGDVLTGIATVEAARLSASRPGLSMATIATELTNQAGEQVLAGRYLQFLLARDASPEPAPERLPSAMPDSAPAGLQTDDPSPARSAERFFDLFEEGDVDHLGSHRFEVEDIVAFARKFDPQDFHLDAERARHSLLGGLCASGWHTAAVFMRLNIRHQTREAARLAGAGRPVPVFGPSPGVSDLKWTSPVRPGDTVSYRQRVAAKRVSGSRPGWGLVTTEVEATRESDGTRVFSMRATVMVRTD